MAITSTQQDILVHLNVTISALSFVASMIVVISIFMGEKGYCCGSLRGVKISRLSFHLIAMISLSDSIRTFGNLFGGPPSDSLLCRIQTFLKVFGGSASFIWVLFVTYVMYQLLVQPVIPTQHLPAESIARYKKIFHCIAWIFAFLCAIIPTAGGFYENANGWCFIEQSNIGIVLLLLCYYLWILLVWLIIAIMYILMYRHVHLNSIIWNDIPAIKKLMYYPVIFFCCWFWALLRRTWNSIDDQVPFAIIALQIAVTSLYGVFNALVYGSIIKHHFKNAVLLESDVSVTEISGRDNDFAELQHD